MSIQGNMTLPGQSPGVGLRLEAPEKFLFEHSGVRRISVDPRSRAGSTEQLSALNGNLAGQLSDLARNLQQVHDTDSILDDIVQAALRLVPGAAHGSISVVKAHRQMDSRAASGDLPRRIDALQSEVGQGPCLQAAYEEAVVRAPDLSTEHRWPKFSHQAWRLGARSMLAFRLFVQDDNLGALNLYGDHVHAFDDECEEIGLLVASHASIAFADMQEINQLNDALATRDLIGQAKGILMERFKITAPQAFVLLVQVSSTSNTKLREVAERVTNSGEFTKRRR
jgi:transcriptional regulator with GAF, ATPase, and Fis domain